jgi:hypothetical protein
MSREISWHKDCIISQIDYNNDNRSLIDIKRYILLKEEISFYNKQISCAEEKGMATFDRDRFMKKDRLAAEEAAKKKADEIISKIKELLL